MATTGRMSGRSGKITLNTVDWHVTTWSADITAEALETTDSSSGSYREYIEGLVSGTVSADFNLITTAMPHSNAGWKRGATAAVTLNIGDSTKNLTGSIIVTAVSYRNDIRGQATGSMRANFTGTITEPT